MTIILYFIYFRAVWYKKSFKSKLAIFFKIFFTQKQRFLLKWLIHLIWATTYQFLIHNCYLFMFLNGNFTGTIFYQIITSDSWNLVHHHSAAHFYCLFIYFMTLWYMIRRISMWWWSVIITAWSSSRWLFNWFTWIFEHRRHTIVT